MDTVKYLHLEPNSGKTWVIGDIHGYVNTFKTILLKIKPQPGDRVILLGDLVDRGPDSKGVFDTILDQQEKGLDLLCIRGNHDDLMLKSYVEEQENQGLFKFIKRDYTKRSWFNMGGDSTMKSFNARKMVDIDPKYYELIDNMYHYLEDENHFYVHAGFDFSKEKPFEDIQAMMWIRDFNAKNDIVKGKKIVHGHTPLDLEFIQEVIENPTIHDFIALDNGVSITNVYGKGNLLAYETKSKTLLVQAKQD